MRKKESLEEVCREIVEVAKEHSYLWNDPILWEEEDQEDNPDRNLYILGGWIAQDENFSIYLSRKEGKFLFGGENFLYHEEEGLEPREAAKRIKKDFERYGINSATLREHFYSALEKPLGRYLAKKKIKKIYRRKEQ